MKLVAPITITPAMLTNSSVTEDDYDEWSATDTVFVEYNQTTLDWTGIAVDSLTGDVYGCSATEILWSAIAVDENTKTVYSCANGGDIYFRAQGDAYFSALSQTSRAWSGIAIDYVSGDVYACTTGGDIYKRTAGVGDFTALSQTSRAWSSITIDSVTHDVYACTTGGDIYKQTAAAGNFIAMSQTSRAWSGITVDPSTADAYACVTDGDVYKRTAGAGNFIALGQTTRAWTGVSVNSDTGDVFGSVSRIGIFVYGPAVYFEEDRVISLTDHNIYESLTDSNLRKDPVTDSLLDTPAWIKVSATNRWKMFDTKTASKTENASSIVVVLTPGVALTSVSLLEVEATQVVVSATLPTYSKTVNITDDITDLVFSDLAATSSSVITITITKSTTAVCGMVIIGTPIDLGITRWGVDAGINNYSRHETDTFGTVTTVIRDYAKRASFDVLVGNDSINSTQRTLAQYKDTPVLWIGNESLATTILFGIYHSFTLLLAQKNETICSLDIDGSI